MLKSMQANGGDYNRITRAAVEEYMEEEDMEYEGMEEEDMEYEGMEEEDMKYEGMEEEDMEDEGIIAEDYDKSSPVPMWLYSLGFVSVLFIIGVKVTVSVYHK